MKNCQKSHPILHGWLCTCESLLDCSECSWCWRQEGSTRLHAEAAEIWTHLQKVCRSALPDWHPLALPSTACESTWQGPILGSADLIWRVTDTGHCNSSHPKAAWAVFSSWHTWNWKSAVKWKGDVSLLSVLHSLHKELGKRWHFKTHFLRHGDKDHYCSNRMLHQPLE